MRGGPGYRILGSWHKLGRQRAEGAGGETGAGATLDFSKVGWDWKYERIKAGAEMYFLRGEKKTVKPPPMISYWTWQIGCPVAMDARQSLSSPANQAERRSQHLPSQK